MLPSIILSIFTITTGILFLAARSGYIFWFLNSYEDMIILQILNFVCLAGAIIYYVIKRPRKYLFNSKERGEILSAYDERQDKATHFPRTLIVSERQFIDLIDKKPVEYNDSLQIYRLGDFEQECTAVVRSENNAGYSIEVRVTRINDTSVRLEIV